MHFQFDTRLSFCSLVLLTFAVFSPTIAVGSFLSVGATLYCYLIYGFFVLSPYVGFTHFCLYLWVLLVVALPVGSNYLCFLLTSAISVGSTYFCLTRGFFSLLPLWFLLTFALSVGSIVLTPFVLLSSLDTTHRNSDWSSLPYVYDEPMLINWNKRKEVPWRFEGTMYNLHHYIRRAHIILLRYQIAAHNWYKNTFNPKFEFTLGLSTRVLKRIHWIQISDPYSKWSRVSSTWHAYYVHCTAGLNLTLCPGALSRTKVCSWSPSVEAKWSLDPDPRSASDPDPRSGVESPIVTGSVLQSMTCLNMVLFFVKVWFQHAPVTSILHSFY